MVTWILAAISFCGLNLKFALQCHVSQSRYRKYEYFSYYIKRKTIEKYSYLPTFVYDERKYNPSDLLL